MDRWEAGAGRLWGLCVAPGRMGGSAGEVRAEGLRSGVLPPEAWLCAWGAWDGQGCTGVVLASSVLWLLDATWAPRPDWWVHMGVFRGGRACDGLAAGVEAYPAPPGPEAWGVVRDRRVLGCGAVQLGPGWLEPGVRLSVQAGTTDGRHRARGLGTSSASRSARYRDAPAPSFSP